MSYVIGCRKQRIMRKLGESDCLDRLFVEHVLTIKFFLFFKRFFLMITFNYHKINNFSALTRNWKIFFSLIFFWRKVFASDFVFAESFSCYLSLCIGGIPIWIWFWFWLFFFLSDLVCFCSNQALFIFGLLKNFQRFAKLSRVFLF